MVRLAVGAAGRADEVEAGEPGRPDLRSLRVLVVDDNADLVQMLAATLEANGHHVRKALDGRSAVAIARAFRPDVVLLDLGLPEMDGLEVARQLRRCPETADAHLVALTGWGQAQDRQRTREAGFNHHLTKPTQPETLERLLAEFTSQLHARHRT